MYDREWCTYIQKKEKDRGNIISRKDAGYRLKQLESVSCKNRQRYNEAKKNGASEYKLQQLWKGVFVLRDGETGMLRGRIRQPKRESVGLERNGSNADTLRSRHDFAPANYLSDHFEGIKKREIDAGYECDDDRAKQVHHIGRSNKWLRFHCKTKTWRGARTPEPTKDEIALMKSTLNLTAAQRKSRDLFGEMPLLKYSYHLDEDSCEVIRWTIRRAAELGETINPAEANRRYKASYDVARNPAKCPVRRDPATGKVCGRNHYLPSMLRWMPRFERGSRAMLEWFEAEMQAVGEPGAVIETGIRCGDVLLIEFETGDIFSDDDRKVEVVGVDTHAAELKAEEDRLQAEHKAAEEKREKEIRKKQKIAERRQAKKNVTLAPWVEELKREGSKLRNTLLRMPPVEDEVEWVMKNAWFIEVKGCELRELSYDIVCLIVATAADNGVFVYSEKHDCRHGAEWKETAENVV